MDEEKIYYQTKSKILENLLLELSYRYDNFIDLLEEEKARLKHLDFLTGLLSRDSFFETLSYFVKKSNLENRKFFLIILDLDNFKFINNTYGREIGDFVLKAFADFLKDLFEDEEIFIGRTGEDEFSILLWEMENLNSFLEFLGEKIKTFYLIIDHIKLGVTVSAGIASFPQDACSSQELYQKASQALCVSKNRGKSTFTCYHPHILDYFKDVSQIKNLLDRALSLKEVYPFIQPIYNLKKMEPVGGEILLRIRSENRFIVASSFIDVAIKYGYIEEMERILIKKIIQFEEFLKTLRGKALFINKVINSEKRAEELKEVIPIFQEFKKSYDIEVVLEITESSFVEYFELISEPIITLRKSGILFALDDFGGGYTSLKYLLNFDLDFLKIEGSFIKSIFENDKAKLILKNIVNLAKELNIKVVAECIENKEMLDLLKRLEIDYAQGYYLGEPISLEEFINIFKK
ncbi:MAG: GGDEF and EAL domain-containing protein [Thermodesulfobacteriaceae bacterium]|nr:GGDEF and EAL domain-containing protein [Thermodesulfobacteriaceae bacterium]MCX8041168.1 GGDEF and EAL domain-containing protein [Thermodesulfobacteriaceae bacterium]MDW8135194.1 GGDEF and EAL domain-containing protein [Thermodesulfobacterium sp.]